MLLVGQQEGHPACKKTEWWDAGMVTCLSQDADLHMAQLMPLPLTISCYSKCICGSPEGFYVVLHDVLEAQFWSTCRSDAMCQLAEQELFW